MSNLESPSAKKASKSKKPISPVRNIIGVVALLVVGTVAWLEYSRKTAYNAAVTELDKRTQDEANLLSLADTEKLLARSPDGPGSDFRDGAINFTKKTYTWSGILTSHILTVFYTKEQSPHLHHFLTDGATLPEETVAEVMPVGSSIPLPKLGPQPTPKASVKIDDSRFRPTRDPARTEKPASKPDGAGTKSSDGSKSVPTPAPVPPKEEK